MWEHAAVGVHGVLGEHCSGLAAAVGERGLHFEGAGWGSSLASEYAVGDKGWELSLASENPAGNNGSASLVITASLMVPLDEPGLSDLFEFTWGSARGLAGLRFCLAGLSTNQSSLLTSSLFQSCTIYFAAIFEEHPRNGAHESYWRTKTAAKAMDIQWIHQQQELYYHHHRYIQDCLHHWTVQGPIQTRTPVIPTMGTNHDAAADDEDVGGNNEKNR